MFDYINRKRDPIAIAFYWGGVPFGLFWALYQSPVAGFALQAYLATMAAFVFGPFEVHRQNVKQWWFWKSILITGAVVHPLFLVGLWHLDTKYPLFVTGTGTVGLVGFVTGVIEMVLVGEIANWLSQPDQKRT